MYTVHANDAREAVMKMCTLPLLAGENMSARFVVPTVAAAIAWSYTSGWVPTAVAWSARCSPSRRVEDGVGSGST